ncbi:EpsG family protein [Fibrobacter sp. UWH1]|uniref:EpsG family protein n=1 Tax=Fibrobacter sp. UWH1 TaxID=1964354 RepID=UPI0015957017|nr:EpsG family protein [Fibrobacter sp. UWH1]
MKIQGCSKQIELFAFFVFFFYLFFLTAFRSVEIGNDTIAYKNAFEYLVSNGVSQDFRLEKGFQYFCVFIGKIFPDFRFFLFIHSAICYGVVAYYVYFYSKNKYLSCLLTLCLCFSGFTNILRQDLALVAGIVAYLFLKKGRIFAFVLLVVFAAQFHSTAYCLLILLFHRLFDVKPIYLFPIIVVVLVLSAANFLVSPMLLVSDKYAYYLSSNRVGSGWLALGYYMIRSIVFYMFAYYSFFPDSKSRSLTMSVFIIPIFFCAAGFQMNLIQRMADFFFIFAVVELPNAYVQTKRMQTQGTFALLSLVLIAFFFISLIFKPDWNFLYPYSFFWN